MANDSASVVVFDAVSRSRFHEASGILGVPNGLLVSSLKRKRPPKIDIPNVLRDISADIFKGQQQADADAAAGAGGVCFSASGVAVFAAKGKKKFMEDAHKIFHSSNANKVPAIF